MRFRQRIVAILGLVITAVCLILTFRERKSRGVGAHKDPALDGHRLCLLLPYRDRTEELLAFLTHMQRFFAAQQHNQLAPAQVFYVVINQVDSFRFNRASLLNVGFLWSQSHLACDYVALHDVDLMPVNKQLVYRYPKAKQPLHLSAPGLHPKYDYPTFIGGILLLRSSDFLTVNGMSNNYWGWGQEDDEFYRRLQEAGMSVTRPQGINTGTKHTFKHYHSNRKRSRDYRKCYNQRDVMRRRDRVTGINTVKYQVKEEHLIAVNGVAATVINVQLECDETKTPWCDCSKAPKTEAPLQPLHKEDNIMPYLPGGRRGQVIEQ